VVGFVLALVLLALAIALIPVRFTRAIRRGLRDPEFRSLVGLVVLTLTAGTAFYWDVEDWSLLDSFYFSAITLATVGYGDLVPSTPGGKLFTVFYVFAGVGIILTFVQAVAQASVSRRNETRALLGRRSGTPTPDDDPNDGEEGDRE
jgi:voltage-gated potassium channel